MSLIVVIIYLLLCNCGLKVEFLSYGVHMLSLYLLLLDNEIFINLNRISGSMFWLLFKLIKNILTFLIDEGRIGIYFLFYKAQANLNVDQSNSLNFS